MTAINKTVATAATAANVAADGLAEALGALAKTDAANTAFYSTAYKAVHAATYITCERIGRAFAQGDAKVTAKGVWTDVWTQTLKLYAYHGNMVFRGTDTFPAGLKAQPSREARIAYVNSYMKEGKGTNVVESLAKVRKLARLVVEHAAANHADFLKEVARMNDPEAKMEHWSTFVSTAYGETYAAAEAFFADAGSAKRGETDKTAAVVKYVGKLGLTEMGALERIRDATLARLAELADIQARMVPDAEGEAEAEDDIPLAA